MQQETRNGWLFVILNSLKVPQKVSICWFVTTRWEEPIEQSLSSALHSQIQQVIFLSLPQAPLMPGQSQRVVGGCLRVACPRRLSWPFSHSGRPKSYLLSSGFEKCGSKYREGVGCLTRKIQAKLALRVPVVVACRQWLLPTSLPKYKHGSHSECWLLTHADNGSGVLYLFEAFSVHDAMTMHTIHAGSSHVYPFDKVRRNTTACKMQQNKTCVDFFYPSTRADRMQLFVKCNKHKHLLTCLLPFDTGRWHTIARKMQQKNLC